MKKYLILTRWERQNKSLTSVSESHNVIPTFKFRYMTVEQQKGKCGTSERATKAKGEYKVPENCQVSRLNDPKIC